MLHLYAILTLATSASASELVPPPTPVAPSSSLQRVQAGSGPQKRPWLAAGLNWIVPGAGYMYNGDKPAYVTLPMIAGAAGLTYVENFHQFEGGTLREVDSTAFAVTFGSVLVLNTGLAIDAFRDAKELNRGRSARRASLHPTVVATADGPEPGLVLDARF